MKSAASLWAVVGLPQRIEYAFVDEGAKVNQIKFDETKSKGFLQLELEIPEKLDRRFVGRTRTFFAMVTEPFEYDRINAIKAKYGDDPVPEDDIKVLKVNYVKLELIPKGIGKLEVLGVQPLPGNQGGRVTRDPRRVSQPRQRGRAEHQGGSGSALRVAGARRAVAHQDPRTRRAPAPDHTRRAP